MRQSKIERLTNSREQLDLDFEEKKKVEIESPLREEEVEIEPQLREKVAKLEQSGISRDAALRIALEQEKQEENRRMYQSWRH